MVTTNGKRSPWAIVRNFLITRPDGTIYLTRNGFRTPFGGVYVHKMTGPDDRLVPHDHPWSFLSLIVKGGYDEMRINKMDTHAPLLLRRHRRWTFNRMRRDDAHYISRLLENPTWTVVFIGKRRRTWGFWEQAEYAEGEWTWTEFDKTHWEDDRVAAEARLKADLARAREVRQINFGTNEHPELSRNVTFRWNDPNGSPTEDALRWLRENNRKQT